MIPPVTFLPTISDLADGVLEMYVDGESPGNQSNI